MEHRAAHYPKFATTCADPGVAHLFVRISSSLQLLSCICASYANLLSCSGTAYRSGYQILFTVRPAMSNE